MSVHWVNHLMRQRSFAYAEVFCHPQMPFPAFDKNGWAHPGINPAIASVCKNESNCTIFLKDGTWFSSWSQGGFEHALDEQIVFSTSSDMGKTWSKPSTIIRSTEEDRMAYGAVFVAPKTQRIYAFFFAGYQKGGQFRTPEYDAGNLYFVYSDDRGAHWSKRQRVDLPDRDINIFTGRFHGWVNHPHPMPTGELVLPVSMCPQSIPKMRAWMTKPAEVSAVICDNILEETDPARLRFTMWPAGPRGIRVDVRKHWDNPSLRRLLDAFDVPPYESAFNFQEMTVVPLKDGRWLGVGRTFLGSPGYTVSADRGQTWTSVEPLCYRPGGEPIQHPMTMCPIAKTSDGRFVLLITNNDGTKRGAKHIWEGNGRTRNPQWIVVGKEIPGETRNAGLVFGEPMILAEVDDSGETNLKTGISMPQFFERNGRYFVMYNINKEHILLDEIPSPVLDKLTPKG